MNAAAGSIVLPAATASSDAPAADIGLLVASGARSHPLAVATVSDRAPACVEPEDRATRVSLLSYNTVQSARNCDAIVRIDWWPALPVGLRQTVRAPPVAGPI